MVSAMPTSAAVPARFPAIGDGDRTDALPAQRRQRRLLPSRPSSELAVAARAGDTDAAGELYRRTHARARRAALAFCHEADADDAVAEGLSRALHRIDQLADPAAVEGWMVRCVVRAAVDMSRQRQRQRPSGDLAALTERALPASESAADGALAIAERAMMAAAVAELQPRLRLLLHLRYEAGLSVAEVAVALGRPAGTVRRQCVEARRVAGQRFLSRHLRPAQGLCAHVSALLCQEPYRPLSIRTRRQTVDHLRRCEACRARKAEVATVLSELGYRGPSNRATRPS
jgi:RNA polymerase sigma factor (sigma-70 family)